MSRAGRFGRSLAFVMIVAMGPGTPWATPKGSAASVEARGTGSIELNVDGWDGDMSKIGVVQAGQAAWGVRFTPPEASLPFSLTQAATLCLGLPSGRGFAVGDPLRIVVFVDPSGSGDPENAVVVHRQDVAVQSVATLSNNQLNTYDLSRPITVRQGDIYVIFVDRRSMPPDFTPVPVFDPMVDSQRARRSFFALAEDVEQPSSLIRMDRLIIDGPTPVPVLGNQIVRGYGEQASVDAPATRLVEEPVDGDLPRVQNVTASEMGTSVRLDYTAPAFPVPAPTSVAEVEPNDSPDTAQRVVTNVLVTGRAGISDPGSPGGLCDDITEECDDVEDWYRFELDAQLPVTIDLTDFGRGNDLDVLLYRADAAGDPAMSVAQSAAGSDVEEHIVLPILAPGAYLVAVSAYDTDVSQTPGYRLRITAAPRVLRYNVFYSTAGDPTPTSGIYVGSAPAGATSFTVSNSPPGARYIVTAVAGATQTGASNVVGGATCEGGPSVTAAGVQFKGKKIVVSGSGFVDGTTLLVDGVGFVAPAKITASKFTQKGRLADGRKIDEAIRPGSTVTLTFLTPTGGCTAVSVTRPPG